MRASVARRRLERLYEIVKSIPYKQFDMNTWGERKPKCGTVACALGWAARDKGFRKEGLHLDGGGLPTFNGEFGSAAGREFFNLSIGDADDLFLNCSNRKKTQVLKFIQKLAETRGGY